MSTVFDIYNYLDGIAPFKNQDKKDNCGLLIGRMDAVVNKILVCLDVTRDVIAEAVEKQIDLIVSHHPLMYRPVSKILCDDPIHHLIRSNISFIAMHTNLDVADGGVTDLMLKRLGFPQSNEVLEPVNPDGTGYGRVVDLEKAISPRGLALRCKQAFGCASVRYVDGGGDVTRVGLCSGGGGDLVEAAREKGCDAYICGDVRWDRMVLAFNMGFTLIDAGHFHTENIMCDDLADSLQQAFVKIGVEKSVNSIDVCSYVL